MLVHIFFFYFSLRQSSACVADKAKRRNRTIVYNMCSSASVWLMEPVFSLPTYIYLSTVVVLSWEKREENIISTPRQPTNEFSFLLNFSGLEHPPVKPGPDFNIMAHGARVPWDLVEIAQNLIDLS